MKKILVLLILIPFFVSLLVSCSKVDEELVRNHKSNNESIIDKYKKRGDVQIISNDLIIFTEIETNRMQPNNERGPYQCSITENKFIRLSDLRELNRYNLFNAPTEKIIDAIVIGAKSIGIKDDDIERDKIQESIENISFKIINNKEFNFINYDPIWSSCDMQVFEKNIPTKFIIPFLDEWFKSQLN